MKSMSLPLNIVVEDTLSEELIYKIIEYNRYFWINIREVKKGYPGIQKRIKHYIYASKEHPYLIVVDEDKFTCANAVLVNLGFVNGSVNTNTLLRIAVKETESWLLADTSAIARYFKIKYKFVPRNPDRIRDPKKAIFQIALKSRKREIREGITPQGTAKVGPEYDALFIEYINKYWSIDNARRESPSLDRTLRRIDEFYRHCIKSFRGQE